MASSPLSSRPAYRGYCGRSSRRGRFGAADLAAELATCPTGPRRRGQGIESDAIALERGRLDGVIAGLLFMAGMRAERGQRPPLGERAALVLCRSLDRASPRGAAAGAGHDQEGGRRHSTLAVARIGGDQSPGEASVPSAHPRFQNLTPNPTTAVKSGRYPARKYARSPIGTSRVTPVFRPTSVEPEGQPLLFARHLSLSPSVSRHS